MFKIKLDYFRAGVELYVWSSKEYSRVLLFG